MNDELEQPEKRKVGRPPGAKTAEQIWEEELLAVVKLAKQVREFAAEQLKRLQEKAGGIDSVDTQMELSELSCRLVNTLTKTAGEMVKLQSARPGEQKKDKEFDFEAWVEEVKK